MALEALNFPRMFQIRQKFEVPPPIDLRDGVDDAFSGIASELISLKGMRVAVCVGSRGIDGIVPVVKRTVERLKAVGADVFILPAMGSHGGATVEGQIELLAHRGIVEESVDCKIIGVWKSSVLEKLLVEYLFFSIDSPMMQMHSVSLTV
jgi:hypothetical protein